MKLIIGIILVIVVGGLITLGIIMLINGNASPQTVQTTPAQLSASPSTTGAPTSMPAATVNPTSSSLPGSSPKVDFALQITKVSETGALSRSITGEITNTGSSNAHNVICKVQIYSNGKLIKFNDGQDSVIAALGTIKAGQTVTTTVDLSFGLFDGLTLNQNGATVNLQISSDEKTQVLSYEYKP